MAGEPVSYVIPAFSRQARFLGIMWWEDTMATAGTTLTRRMQIAVDDAGARKIRIIANAPLTLETRARLGSYGLQPTGECDAVHGYSPTGAILACDLKKSNETGPAAVTLTPGLTVRFDAAGHGFVTLLGDHDLGWTLPGAMMDVRDGRRLALLFQSGLQIAIASQHTLPTRSDSADSSPEEQAGFTSCLPPGSADANGLVSIMFRATAEAERIQLLSFTTGDIERIACP
jgi:hypothetical protein